MKTKVTKACSRNLPGSTRGSRVLFGGAPNSSLGNAALHLTSLEKLHFLRSLVFGQRPKTARQRRALPRIHIRHASFLRNRRAHRLKSRFDIAMRTRRFGQYSRRFAPRRMIARMSAMKYVVGNSAPSA